MKKKPQEPTPLLDQQQALHAYLDALLSEIPAAEDEAAMTAADSIADTRPSEEPVAPEARRVPQVITDPPAAPAAEPEAPALRHVDPVPAVPPEPPVSSLVPDWAEGDFQALCFRVAGVTLATPLIKLNSIVELSDELTELPGYAPWVMGILTHRGRQTQVVDLAHIILPEGRKAEAAHARERVHYVILVNDGHFGLAADSLSQVITLRAEEVRWRTEHSRRPWLAGMVIERMCAILDIEHLTEQMAGAGGPVGK